MASGKVFHRVCRQCGREFETTSQSMLICSDECRAVRAYEHSRQSRARHRIDWSHTTCVVCGQEFDRKSKTRKYCGDRCRNIGRSTKYNATLSEEEMRELFADYDQLKERPHRTLDELVAESNKRHISYGKLQGEIYVREH